MKRNYLVVVADARAREALADELRNRGVTVTLAETGAQARRVVDSVSISCAVVESHIPDMSVEELRGHIESTRPECRVVVLTSFQLVRNTPELLRFGLGDCVIDTGQVFNLLESSQEDDSDFTSLPLDVRGTRSLFDVIDVLVGLLELEHRDFSNSSHQVMKLARATAEELGALDHSIDEIILGALLRDVGKAGLAIKTELADNAPAEERNRLVRDHVDASMRLIEHIDFPWKVLPVVRHHHERYDGSGSPDGLCGREIPIGARIVAVVDAFVAMTAGKREQALDSEDALRELVRHSGHRFDPEVVEAFHRVIDKRMSGRRSKGNPFVLLMESNSEFRRLIKMRLLNEGFKVREVSSYEKCMQQMLKSPPDLSLVEIDADPSGAFQLLQEMQKDENLCRIPIAFVSRQHDRILRIRALRQGVDDFISKDDPEELVARAQSILVREAVRSGGEARQGRKGISGSLEDLSLPDIVQTLTIGMKTACVGLRCNGDDGTIWFEEGRLLHAETGELDGEEAFYRMVRWVHGEFVIEHGVRNPEKTVTRDAMFLLMEGLRLMDEATQDGAKAVS